MTDETTTDDGEIVITPAGRLPDFEGLTPVGVLTSLQGAGERITRALHLDEKIVLVVEARVTNVQHPMSKAGVKRQHVLKVADLYELPGRRGARLLTALKKAWRLSDDASQGRTAIEELAGAGDDLELTVDGAGVVLTDADLADLGLADPANDPVVVVFEGGARAMWPDDFAPEVTRPAAGERIAAPGAGDDLVLVRQLLDARTGEPEATWSDEDEQERLLAEERAAAVAEDLEAAAGLERGRMENRQPFEGYDDADVGLIKLWLAEDAPGPWACEHVAVYEDAHKGRKTVIAAARERRAELEAEAAEAGDEPAPDEVVGDGTGEALPPLPDEMYADDAEDLDEDDFDDEEVDA